MRLHFRSAQAVNTTSGAAPQARLDIVSCAGSQAVTFGAQAPRTFVSGGTFALDPMATASSGLPVSYRTQTADVCTISGSTVTMQSAGTCTIAADQPGNDDYAAAATVTQSIAIGDRKSKRLNSSPKCASRIPHYA